ncbi:MAG: methyl-accepting chemotaxis protein, partial [Coriobacteriia bacterium]
EKVRSSEMKRGLSFTFTLLTWLTRGPAVMVGLLATGIFALTVLEMDFDSLRSIAVFGAIAMALCAIPGSLAWRAAFKRRVLEPLRDLGAVLVEAGQGDLTVRAAAPHDDEIGLLVSESNGLISSLSGIALQLRTSAESVTNMATQLSASSQEISASSMEISTSVQQVAHGAELQSRKVEETSSAIEAISDAVTQIADRAMQASRTSDAAAQYALQGEQSNEHAMSKINEALDAIITLSASVEKLGQRSNEIGHIVDVITTIADQTNLLSLNAAIEAARAGESGRGFSVVAEEVRKLAEGSGKAAEQIGELIKEVQFETSNALKYMQIGTTEVRLGAEVVGQSGEALRQITDAVTKTAELAQDIADTTARQAKRASEIDRAMHDIAAVVEENAASAQETAAATEQQTACMEEISSSAQDLADMAHRLEESAMQFKTSEAGE